jgi:predicted RNA-binding Zn ribbon-like protein
MTSSPGHCAPAWWTRRKAAVAEAWAVSPAAGGRALTAVKQTREALSAALAAVLSPPDQPDPGARAPDLEYLSLTWAATVSRSQLTLDPSGPAIARLGVGSSPALLIPDRVAHAAVDLLCHVDLTYLGMCPVDAGGCGWVFIDRSRNRSRRWCTMDSCGAYAKSRRLTERRRAARSSYQ